MSNKIKRKTVQPFDFKQCPHCDSTDVECVNNAPKGLFSYEWFCNNCDEQWNQYGEDTK